jgi:hypothetical protein
MFGDRRRKEIKVGIGNGLPDGVNNGSDDNAKKQIEEDLVLSLFIFLRKGDIGVWVISFHFFEHSFAVEDWVSLFMPLCGQFSAMHVLAIFFGVVVKGLVVEAP